MENQPIDLRRFFDTYVPRRFQRDILQRCIIKGYEQAAEECLERYGPEEAHDLRPHVRRAKIEGLFRALVPRHPEMSATTSLNAAGNAYHVEATSGRVVMTVSVVDTPNVIVREARYRQTLARRYQLSFEGLNGELPPPPDATLWALVIHGPADSRDGRLPGFVHVVFPTSDCADYIDRIDLLARFREIPELKAGSEIEAIPDQLRLDFRPIEREREG